MGPVMRMCGCRQPSSQNGTERSKTVFARRRAWRVSTLSWARRLAKKSVAARRRVLSEFLIRWAPHQCEDDELCVRKVSTETHPLKWRKSETRSVRKPFIVRSWKARLLSGLPTLKPTTSFERLSSAGNIKVVAAGPLLSISFRLTCQWETESLQLLDWSWRSVHHLLVNFHVFISNCGEELRNLCVRIIRRHKIKIYGSP